jgi:plasmid stability protein
MACRKAWSREILVNNFTQKFVSRTYKTRREALLLEREKSMMPATQPYVETEKAIRKIGARITEVKKAVERANEKWGQIGHKQLGVLAVEHGLSSEFEASILRHKLGQEERKVVSSLMIDVQHLEWHQQQLTWRLHGGALDQEKRQFVRACPYADCKGFLSTAWKCGVCENWTCPTCHEGKGPEKDGPHTCNADNVATAELLARDSRHCPKCAALIFKINGCDQMYCTQCHTAFSWRTGRVETGVIHNPHYYEYHRANGTLQRNPGDVPCGGFPEWGHVSRLVGRQSAFFTFVANAHRSYAHCQWALIPRYTTNLQDNRDLRIKFMIGDIDEDEFKKKIQQREKARQRKTDIRQVLEMATAVLTDLFQNFVQHGGVDGLMTALEGLRSHVNDTMATVSRRYSNCAVPKFRENFDVY